MDMTNIIAAAATAAGVAPPQGGPAYSEWRGRVLGISADLAAMVTGHESREARKQGLGLGENEKVTSFHARLVKVKEITKGQGDNQIQKGQLSLQAFSSNNVDADGLETIETAPLGTPEGDEEFMRAKALIGQSVIIYKRNFLHPTDKSKKLKELVAIDPASGFSAAPSAAPASTAPTPAPPVSPRLTEIREQLGALTDDEKTNFRDFLSESQIVTRSAEWTSDNLDSIEAWLVAE